MRILDRYITSSIVFVFSMTLIMFCLLYVLIDATSNLDEFLKQKVPLTIIAQYYLSYLPVIIVQTASITCLIATLFSYSSLNTHNEIIAMRASGLNFWRISRPAIFFAIFIAFVAFFLSEKYVPQAESRARKIRDEHLVLEVDRAAKKKAKINYLTYYGLKNRLYFIDTFDPNTFEMSGITFHEYNDKLQLVEKTVALNGTWTGIAWKFYKVNITTITNPETGESTIKAVPEKLMDIKESPQDFLKQSLDTKSMNSRQLYQYIKRFSKSGAVRAINNLRVDMHEKFARPFSIIVVVLTGLPLALMTGRRKAQTFMSLAVAIAIGFFYAICNSVGIALGKGGFLWPLVSAWLAPVIFTGLAFYLIKKKF